MQERKRRSRSTKQSSFFPAEQNVTAFSGALWVLSPVQEKLHVPQLRRDNRRPGQVASTARTQNTHTHTRTHDIFQDFPWGLTVTHDRLYIIRPCGIFVFTRTGHANRPNISLLRTQLRSFVVCSISPFAGSQIILQINAEKNVHRARYHNGVQPIGHKKRRKDWVTNQMIVSSIRRGGRVLVFQTSKPCVVLQRRFEMCHLAFTRLGPGVQTGRKCLLCTKYHLIHKAAWYRVGTHPGLLGRDHDTPQSPTFIS